MKAKWGRLLHYGRSRLHSLKLTVRNWKWWFPIGISFSRGPPFSGAFAVSFREGTHCLSWLSPSHWKQLFFFAVVPFNLLEIEIRDRGIGPSVCRNSTFSRIDCTLPTFDPANSFAACCLGTLFRRRVSTSKRPSKNLTANVLPNRKIGQTCPPKWPTSGCPSLENKKRWAGDLPQQSWSLEVRFSGGQLKCQFWWLEMMRPLFPTFMASSMSNPPTPTMSRTSMLSLVGNPSGKVLY